MRRRILPAEKSYHTFHLVKHVKSPLAFMLAVFFIASTAFALQDSSGSQATPKDKQVSEPAPLGDADSSKTGVRLPRQPGDAKVDPLPSDQLPTKAEQDAANAMSWFLAGRIHERRNDLKKAYAAYTKSIELNPKSFPVYRALIPLAFSMDRKDEAIELTRKAVELNPDDYELLWQLASHEIKQNNLEGSIKYFEQARDSEDLDKQSAIYVTIQQQLGELYRLAGRAKDAAGSYEVVFRAMRNPSDFNLSFQMRSRLRANASKNYEVMGQVFLVAEKYKLATEAFEEAARTSRQKPQVLGYNLARVSAKQKKYSEALKQLRRYLDANLSSKGRGPYVLLAEILNQLERADDLIPELEKLAAEAPKNDSLHYFLADQYVNESRLDEAQKIYEQRMEDRESDEGFIGLVRVYRKRGNAEKLLDMLGAALAKGANPILIEAELELVGNDANLAKSLFEVGRKRLADKDDSLDFAESLILGQIAIQADDADAALDFYNSAIEQQERPSLSLYRGIALFLLEKERYEEGIDILQRAVDEPAFAQQKTTLLYLLSQAQEFGGQTDEALASIQKARSIEPENAAWHFHEGWVYAHSRQWEKAIAIFEQVIDTYTSDADKSIVRQTQYNLSNVHVQAGDLKKGEEVLEEVLAEEPDNISVNNDLGYLYADQGKHLEKAKAMIEKALKSDPENPAYLDSMGWVLYQLGEAKAALKYLKDAVKLRKSGDAVILDHLADCYQALGKRNQAIANWQKALEHEQEARFPDEKLIESLRTKIADSQKEASQPSEDSEKSDTQ